MRKPVLDESHGGPVTAAGAADLTPPHVDQTHTTQVHNEAAGAGAFAGVIAGDIGADAAAAHGDTKVGELTATGGHHVGGDGASTGTTAVAAHPLPPSLQQLDQREERVKKSVAYRHTVFHRFALDKLGKQYEKRMCSYCSAAFSFKGGTTSAALRHLKTSHPERLLYTGNVNMAMALAQQLQHQLQQQLQVQDQQQKQLKAQHHQDEQQQEQLYGDAEPTKTNDSVEQDAGVVEDQQDSVEDQVAVSAPAPLSSSHDAEHAFDESASSNGGATEYVDHPAVALHETMDGVVMEGDGGHADEDESEVVPDEKHLRPTKARQAGKRKRQREDTDSSGGNNNGGSNNNNNAAAVTFPPPLTASQQAIMHFLLHYKEMLSLPNCLRFVKHLTHHPREAEMYNVLDAATQMEYVREFSDHATTI